MRQHSRCGKCVAKATNPCAACLGTNVKLRNVEQTFIRAKQMFDLDRTVENLNTMSAAWIQYRHHLFQFLADIYDNLVDDDFKADTGKYANLQKNLIAGYREALRVGPPPCNLR